MTVMSWFCMGKLQPNCELHPYRHTIYSNSLGIIFAYPNDLMAEFYVEFYIRCNFFDYE